jgi:DNA-binding NarL/FixJ family response regulator
LDRVLERLDISVIARVRRPAEALEVLAEERPELFVFALEESGAGEAACVRAARAIAPDLVVVVCSSRREPASIDACLEAGAAAYILKTSTEADLLSAIGQAFDRTIYLFNPVRDAEPPPDEGAGLPLLTGRETEVLRLVAIGCSNGEVARRLWLSEPTVKLHLSHIYTKLGVKNRTAASVWAHAHGVLADLADADHSGASYKRLPPTGLAVGA